ncbi:hypothetical protein [Tritonibacter aquimaris]|nr:hypothetical protein [Tritonibacter aquimaris]
MGFKAKTNALKRYHTKNRRVSGPYLRRSLDCRDKQMYLSDMTLEIAQHFDLEDRARLRERFFGAARTVLARL